MARATFRHQEDAGTGDAKKMWLFERSPVNVTIDTLCAAT
ncbi:hypothetical protein SCOCK_60216 [Actinacidiphila cocklensis]|uniref:Uncharacterized protein n=1 Tax=Actinacidiphila cocklensis TaxID=887465 RepID=A0A9W4DXV7_9ACTN|nr:hypothetical protein SCOCK_60216 [Actinacidiphila cocklensis]